MDGSRNGGSKVRSYLQTVLLIVSLAYIFVDKMVLPSVRTDYGSAMNAIERSNAVQDVRLQSLEENMRKIETIISDVASLKTTAERNRALLEELNKDFKTHIAQK